MLGQQGRRRERSAFSPPSSSQREAETAGGVRTGSGGSVAHPHAGRRCWVARNPAGLGLQGTLVFDETAPVCLSESVPQRL